MWRRSALATLALIVLLPSARGKAAEDSPLPEFRVLDPEGASVTSRQLTTAQRWVLLYVAPGCAACDDLSRATGRWQPPGQPARIIVVVRGSVQESAAFVEHARPRGTVPVPWFADAAGEAWQALKLSGVPMLIGVEDNVVKWSIAGVLNDPNMVNSVVRTWLER